MSRPVRLEGGMCDGWIVPWPDDRPVEHYRHPDRPDDVHRYQLKLGDPDVATYQRPLMASEAGVLEGMFKAEMEAEDLCGECRHARSEHTEDGCQHELGDDDDAAGRTWYCDCSGFKEAQT